MTEREFFLAAFQTTNQACEAIDACTQKIDWEHFRELEKQYRRASPQEIEALFKKEMERVRKTDPASYIAEYAVAPLMDLLDHYFAPSEGKRAMLRVLSMEGSLQVRNTKTGEVTTYEDPGRFYDEVLTGMEDASLRDLDYLDRPDLGKWSNAETCLPREESGT